MLYNNIFASKYQLLSRAPCHQVGWGGNRSDEKAEKGVGESSSNDVEGDPDLGLSDVPEGDGEPHLAFWVPTLIEELASQ